MAPVDARLFSGGIGGIFQAGHRPIHPMHRTKRAIMKWNGPDYERGMTGWLVRYLRKLDVRETHFSREAGLGKGGSGARTFRKIKAGERHWSLIDLCKVANYFDETPSAIMDKVERFCQAQGLLNPSQTAAKVIDMGLASSEKAPTLISTWRQAGDDFILVDCDAKWKKIAKGEIRWLIGLGSREIFATYPEVSQTLRRAWQTRHQASTAFWYRPTTRLAKKVLCTNSTKKYLSATAVFVPPDMVVTYTRDLTDDQEKVKPDNWVPQGTRNHNEKGEEKLWHK